MFTLILETSTEKGVVVIADKETLLFEERLDLQAIRGSTLLFEVIQAGFKNLRVGIEAIKAIGVGIGPGSFTGIRVAAAVAQGMALPKKLPLIGFSSFTGFISQEKEFVTIIDAKIGGAYVLHRENQSGKILDGEPQFVKKENLYFNKKIVSPFLSKLGLIGEEIFPSGLYLAKVVESKYLNDEFSRGYLPLEYLELKTKENNGILGGIF